MTWQPGALTIALREPVHSAKLLASSRERLNKQAVAETRSMKARLKPKTLAPPLPVPRAVAPTHPVRNWAKVYPWKLWHEHTPKPRPTLSPTPTPRAAATPPQQSGMLAAAGKSASPLTPRRFPMALPLAKTPLDTILDTPPLTMAEELAALRAQNATLSAALASRPTSGIYRLYCKVGAKGGVCLYGLGRYPFTGYKEQWLAILDASEMIRDFISANADKLTVKVRS